MLNLNLSVASTVEDYASACTDILKQIENPVIYDLGCGGGRIENAIGLDLYPADDQTIKADLFKKKWPIKDNSADILNATHFLEHVPDWKFHWREAYRVLKPGGIYKFTAPYLWSERYWMDPSHCQPILELKFNYLNKRWMKLNKLEHSGDYPDVNFSLVRFWHAIHQDYKGKSVEVINHAATHQFNVIMDIAGILQKLPAEE